MTLSAVHPYFEMALERRRAAKIPDFGTLPPEGSRALMRQLVIGAPPAQDLPELSEVTNTSIPGPHGPIPIRRYRPRGEVAGTCVYYHAGGWVIGDLDTGDNTCRRLAGGANVEVVSVDYRLAPEHPWPRPLDDCYAALQWAAQACRGPLFVAGESAGGNLAASVAIRARDQGGPAIVGQVIVYGVMDYDLSRESYRAVGDRSWMLTTADMRYFWDHYCPDEATRASPLLSPLRLASSRGLPPLLMLVGDLDVLRDECVAYAEKLRAADVPVVLRVDPGMLHGYFGMTEWAQPAREAADATIVWIKDRAAAADR